jgi:hypothetical protein
VVKERPDLLGGVTTVLASGYRRPAPAARWWPYTAVADEGTQRETSGEPVELTAIPYYAWANRQDGAMRVWLPTS